MTDELTWDDCEFNAESGIRGMAGLDFHKTREWLCKRLYESYERFSDENRDEILDLLHSVMDLMTKEVKE